MEQNFTIHSPVEATSAGEQINDSELSDVRVNIMNSFDSNNDIGAWPFIWRAVWLLKRGAPMAACGDLIRVKSWREEYFKTLKEEVPFETILNCMAEFLHNNSFGKSDRLDLIWGVLLGLDSVKAKDYFSEIDCFTTRVVGLEYEDRWTRAKNLKASETVVLVPEPENPYDEHAVRVYSSQGHELGYLRRTLAAEISKRLARGEKFTAKIAVVLGDEFYPDERVNIRVEKVK